ncbi:MAG: GNAT family N-acetyltransferase [Candidatus Eremiobacteraeota bacterium]|nr:GNAT family N-acetyltransferase [Candidatus Eremiobacteraeota bacterium]
MSRQWVASVVASQPAFRDAFRPGSLERVRQRRLQELSDPDLQIHSLESVGYLAWDCSMVEPDTGQPVANLWDLWVAPDQSFEQVAHQLWLLSDLGARKPMVELTDPREGEFWRSLGFHLRRHRIGKTPVAHDDSTQERAGVRLRRGQERDRTFVTTLAAANLHHTLPPGGQAQSALYLRATTARFGQLDFDQFPLIVAQDRRTYVGVGYLILEPEEHGSAYLYDMGVRSTHWGRLVAQALVRGAETELVDSGFTFFHAEVSAANRRSLLTARRTLSFAPLTEWWSL